MARYAVSSYGSSFYGAPLLSVFAADPFTAVPVGYGEIQLEWVSPGGAWDELRLIQSYVGYPATQENGTVVYTAELGADVHNFKNIGLLTDRWVYYAIYVHDPTQDLWIKSGITRAYSPRSYAGGKRLYDLLPEIVKSESLQRFMDIFGFAYDGLRNDANSLLDLYDADHVLYDLVPVLLEQFGVPRETELEPEQYRRFLRNAIHFYKTKGTSECAHGVIAAVTGWPNVVALGENLLWDSDFSDFVGGLGYWGRGASNCTVTWVPASIDTDGSPLPPAMRMTSTVGSGIWAAFVNMSDVPADLHRLAIPVVPGASYSLGALVRASDTSQARAYLDIAWYDLSGVFLGFTTGPTIATRQGVDSVVQSPNMVAPPNAVWAVPMVLVDATTAAVGSYWDIRQMMFNRGTTVLPHEPGRNIRIYLDITDTDPLRIAVHKTRLIDILPRYLPFGATFSLIDGLPVSEVVISDDTILVDYDPPPATAPVGRALSILFRDLVDNANVLNAQWAVRQTVAADLTVEFNTDALVHHDLTAEWNVHASALPTMPGSPATATNDHTGGTTIVAPLPSVVAAGDLLLLAVGYDAAPGTITVPGWTLVETGDRQSVFSKVAGSAETAPTVTFTNNPGDRTTITRGYRGSAGTPVVAASATINVTNSASCTAGQPSYTGRCMAVYFWTYFESFSVGSLTMPGTVLHQTGIGEVVVISGAGDEDLGSLAGTAPARTATGAGGTDEWTGTTVIVPYA